MKAVISFNYSKIALPADLAVKIMEIINDFGTKVDYKYDENKKRWFPEESQDSSFGVDLLSDNQLMLGEEGEESRRQTQLKDYENRIERYKSRIEEKRAELEAISAPPATDEGNGAVATS